MTGWRPGEVVGLLALGLLAAGCFNPSYRDGQFSCPDLICPAGLTCSGAPDFLCLTGSAPPRDLGTPDLGPPDAPDGGRTDVPQGLDTQPDRPGQDPRVDAPGPDGPPGDAQPLPDAPPPDTGPDGCVGDECLVTLVIGHNTGDDLATFLEAELDESTPDRVDTEHTMLDVQGISSATNMVERETSLMRADLTGVSGRVLSASLRIFIENAENNVQVHEVLQDWTPSSTYNEALPGVPWTSPGCAGTPPLPDPPCRAEPALFAADLLDTGAFMDIPLPLEMVQRWLDEPGTNRGVLFRIDPADGNTGSFGFTGSAGPDGQRPRFLLQIERR